MYTHIYTSSLLKEVARAGGTFNYKKTSTLGHARSNDKQFITILLRLDTSVTYLLNCFAGPKQIKYMTIYFIMPSRQINLGKAVIYKKQYLRK